MNANELAEIQAFKTEELTMWERNTTATMLRQQQVLIENLNGRIERMIEKQSHYEAMAHAGGFEAGRELGMKQERERNNEPVAWTDGKGNYFDKNSFFPVDDLIPLYTHPVKELTEILSTIKCIADDVSPHKEYENTYSDGWLDACNTVYDEVFAILRKAQEK